MKRILEILLTAAVVLSLVACGPAEQESSPAGQSGAAPLESSSLEEGEDAPDISSGQSSRAPDDASAIAELKLPNRPIAAAADTFIVQDKTTERYGLINDTGGEILPNEYGDMYYITVNPANPQTCVAVQEKGSYGVYDLAGSVMVTPYYDNIQAAEYGDFLIAEYHGQYALVDLKGNELLGPEYEQITVSLQQTIAALKTDGAGYTLHLFDQNLSAIGSYPLDLSQVQEFYFSDNGKAVAVQESAGNWVAAAVRGKWYGLDGNRISEVDAFAASSGCDILYPYLTYAQEGQLRVEDVRTNTVLWSAPLAANESVTTVSLSPLKNLSQGETSIKISVTGYTPASSGSFDRLQDTFSSTFIVTLGQQATGFCAEDLGIAAYSVACFCDGTSFAMSSDQKLLVIDPSGNIVSELKVPFSESKVNSVSPNVILMANCAILNNNGYWYAINKEGETISPEEGYSGYDGLLTVTALKTPDGYIEVLNSNGDYIITKDSSITSLDQPVESTTPNINLVEYDLPYYFNVKPVILYDQAKDRYHLINSDSTFLFVGLAAVDGTELGDPATFDATMGPALLNGSGYLFGDCDGTKLYGAAETGEGYLVRFICDLAE